MAKVETEVSVRVGVDSSEASKKIEELKAKLQLASENLNSLKKQFGENSDEVKRAESEIVLLSESIAKIKPVDVVVEDAQALVKIDELKSDINSISSKEIEINANSEQAKSSIDELNKELSTIDSKSIELNADNSQAKNSINELTKDIEGIESKSIEINADNKNAIDSINEVNQDIANISSKQIEINADNTDAIKEIENVRNEINSISTKEIKINADNTDATKEIDEVKTDVSQIPDEKNVQITADNQASITIGELKNQLNEAISNVEKLKLKFGENSDEVKLAEQEVQKLNKQLSETNFDENKVEGVKSLKEELRDAQKEFLTLSNQFGEFSEPAQEAAKKVAELKDQIGDAKSLTDAFNPDAKFTAFSGALQSVVGGFAALQGAQALFGSQSEELEKTLVKVQGALALSQGINSILEAKDSLKILKTVAIDAFKGIKTAIGSTGIGLLVVALGSIVAYWDDIKEAVSGVSEESKKQNELLKQNVETENDKLTALNSQDNILKLQGKTEKEILTAKLKQYDIIIKATEAQIAGEETVQKQKEENAKRNFEITKNIIRGGIEISTLALRLLSAPIDAVLAVANKVSETLGFGKIVSTDLNDQITKLNEGVSDYAASFLFDPKKVKEEGEKTTKEAKASLEKLKNDRAGIQLQINNIDKQAQKEADDRSKEALEREKSANEELKKLRQENAVNSLNSEREQAYKKIEIDKSNEDERIKNLKISNETKIKLLSENENKYNLSKNELDEKFRKEDEEKRIAYETRVSQLETEIRIAGIKDQFEKQKVQVEENYKNQYAEIEKNETLNAEQKLELKKKLQIKEQQELDAITQNQQLDLLNKQVKELDAIIQNENSKLSAKKDALTKEEELNKEYFEKGLLTQEEYNKNVKLYSDERTKIAEEEANTRIEIAGAIGDSLGKLSELVGKQTAVGKGLAIAQATINTYLGATEVIKQKSVLPEPAATISKVINVATIIASGIKAVKEILKVKVSGASGGGSVPSTSGVQAPISPTAQTTTINQEQVNQLSSATTRAFVVESDVSGNQERIRRLNRASRIN